MKINFNIGLDPHTKEFHGGFSQGVVETDEFQKYISTGHPCGYIGCNNRTKARDVIVEEVLRSTGLGDNGIAFWLTSGDGRHLMDSITRRFEFEKFRQHVVAYTTNAFENVTIWSHPDHTGFLNSSNKLRKRIFGY